ncbi:phage tail tape measure protein [Corynebacterium sp. 13CS0277]|uniref:phage tail tape measure protein n=1 Tax=Corynebacterium sp. 13CS0277 TaxID=2071994 RepID=UPI000D0301ED|nr:phage tail tape measure protein [Corynebacterium sp. 13CS0277]PRQ10636.1 phage tail tape measure protein [Corynebacterium sp. 13CS0277]
MAAVGYASLPIAPSMRGIQAKIRKELQKPLEDASKQVGAAMSKNLTDAAEKAARGVENARRREIQAAARVEAAEKKVQAAKSATEKSVRDVATAEKALEAVRAKGDAAVAKAEANVAKVRNDAKATTEQVEAAEKALQAARAKADADVEAAEGRVADAREKSRQATNKLKDAEDAVVSAQKKASDSTKEVKSALQEYERAADQGGKTTKTLGEHFRELGDNAMGGLGGKIKGMVPMIAGGLGLAGLTGFLKDTVGAGMEFDTTLASIQSVSGATAEEMAKVSARAKELGNDSELAGTSAQSAAAAMENLIKGGMSTSEAMEAAKGSIQLAGAAMIDTGQAAEIQVAALNVFGLEAREAGRVADVLTNAANNSATGLVDLGEAFKQGAPSAALLGVSLEDTATAMGLMANIGYKGSIAGTQLKNALDNMLGPTTKQQNAFDDLGLTIQDASGKFVGLKSIAEQLHEAQERMSKEDFGRLLAEGFGDQGKSMAAALAAGGDAWDDLREKMDRAGSAGDKARAMLAGLKGPLEQFANALADISLSIYEVLKPIMTGAVGAATKALEFLGRAVQGVIQFFKEHPGILAAVEAALVGVTAAVVAYNVSLAIGNAGGFIAFLTQATGATKLAELAQMALNSVMALNPWVIAAAGIAFFMTQTEAGQRVLAAFKDAVVLVKDAFGELWGVLVDNNPVDLENGPLAKLFGAETAQQAAETMQTVRGAWDELYGALFQGDDVDGEHSRLAKLVGADRAETITQTFENVHRAWDELKGAFMGNYEGSSALSSLIGEENAQRVLEIVGQVQSAWTDLKNIVTGNTDGAGGGALASLIGQDTVDMITGALDTVREAFHGAMEIGQGFLETIGGLLGPAFSMIKDAVVQLAPALLELGKSMGGAVVSAFKAAWEVVKSLFKVFKALWDLLSPVLLPILKVIAVVVGATLVAAFTLLVGGLRVFAAILTKVAQFLSKVADAFGTLIEWVGKAVSAVADFIAGGINLLLDGFESVKNGLNFLKEHWSGIWTALKTIVTNKVIEIVASAMSIKDKIVDGFKSAGTWLMDAGKNIVNGLLNGIKSMAGSVGGAVKSIMPGPIQRFLPFANGGILAFANGSEDHRAEIAPAGAWRLWAEPETGGEAYIPLAESKRTRSTQILAQVADKFGYKLEQYEDGGFITRTSQEIKEALSKVASPYVFGGWTMNGVDCSGAVSMAVNVFRGLDILDSRTATGTEAEWLRNKGFAEGKGNDGDFRVAFLNGGPGGGHTAAQLPDGTFIESGGNTGQGLTIGGKAGPLEGRGFTDWFYASGGDKLAAGMADGVASALSAQGISPGSTTGTSVQINWGSAQELHSKIADWIGLELKSNASSASIGTSPSGTGDPMLTDANRKDALASWDGPDWGPEYFVHEVARSAKAAGLNAAAAIIGVATTLVESGNPLKMWANNAVPESLSFRHDAVGSDYDSIGLFQQRQAGWGTVKERMTPFDSATMFFDRLKKFDWESMDPGAAAQKVQVSAFPGRYAQQMDAAKELVAKAGVYDTGGVLPHGVAALNLSHTPEIIINGPQLGALNNLANNVGAQAQALNHVVPALERVAWAGNFRDGGGYIHEDDPMVDQAMRMHEFLREIGGDWVSQTKLVRDAERGLAETRASIAADLEAIDKQEAELADLRKQYAEATANGGEATTAALRKVADAEKRLARAREDAATSKNPAKAARKIADAEEKLARAREDAAKSAEKSGDKNAKDATKIAEKITKAEKALSQTRARSEQATLQLEAAERTVIAARVQVIGDLVGKVVGAFQKVADGMREFWESAAKVAQAVEATMGEINKLRLQQVNDYAAMLRAQRELRRAEFDALKTRLQGPVDVARAESALAKAKKAQHDAEMKSIELVTRKGGTSLIDLGAAVDRFTETGIFGLQDLVETTDGATVAMGESVTQVVQQSVEEVQRAAEERMRAEDEVKAAEWAVHTARLANLVAQKQQAAAAEEAQIKAELATLKHGQTVELLQLATWKLGEQAKSFYGMTSQGMSRASTGWGGFGKVLGGLGKVIAGGALALGTGGVGAIPGLLMAAKGVGDIFKGGSDVYHNWGDVKQSWNKASGWERAGLIFGVGGNALASAGGAYLTMNGQEELGASAFELGGTLQDTFTGSVWYNAEAQNKAAQSRYEEQLAALQYRQQQNTAVLDQRLAEAQERNATALEGLQNMQAYTELQQEIAKASSKEEALALHEIGKVYLDNAKKQIGLYDQVATDMRKSRETLEQMEREANERASAVGVKQITVNVPKGSAYSADDLQRTLESVLDQVGNLDYKINQLEESDAGVTASEFRAARAYS